VIHSVGVSGIGRGDGDAGIGAMDPGDRGQHGGWTSGDLMRTLELESGA